MISTKYGKSESGEKFKNINYRLDTDLKLKGGCL
jgi:hypothetical protein